jgi:hypothetical protein
MAGAAGAGMFDTVVAALVAEAQPLLLVMVTV